MARQIAVAREHVMASVLVGLVVIVVSFASGIGIVYRTPPMQVLTQAGSPAPRATPTDTGPAAGQTRGPVNYVGTPTIDGPDPTDPADPTAVGVDHTVRVRAAVPVSAPSATSATSAAVVTSPPTTAATAPTPCESPTGSPGTSILGTPLLAGPLLGLDAGPLEALLALVAGRPVTSPTAAAEPTVTATPCPEATP